MFEIDRDFPKTSYWLVGFLTEFIPLEESTPARGPRRRGHQPFRRSSSGSFGEVRGHATDLVAGQQLCHRAPTRLVLEIEIRKRLPGGVLHDETGVVGLIRPGRREAARVGRLLIQKDRREAVYPWSVSSGTIRLR